MLTPLVAASAITGAGSVELVLDHPARRTSPQDSAARREPGKCFSCGINGVEESAAGKIALTESLV